MKVIKKGENLYYFPGFYKYFITFLFLGILVFGGLLFFHFQTVEAQSAQYEMSGWAWSDAYGWISLNIKNTQGDCEDSGTCYYNVTLDSGNNISGYAWSENVGWICFGATCDSVSGLITPEGGNSYAQIDSSTGKITGWANVISLENDGWIHFHRGGSAGAQEGKACYDCEPACERLTCERCDDQWQNCQLVDQCVTGGDGSCIVQDEYCREIQPCIVYSDEKFESCNTCFSETLFDGEVPVTAIDPVAGGSGYACTSCRGNDIVGDDNQYCKKVLSITPDTTPPRTECLICPSCELYGASMDTQTAGIVGWAWGGSEGSGWVHFNLINGSGGSYVVYPWLETLYGSIYTSEAVRQKAGTSGKNATYCIFADSVERVASSDCESRVVSGVEINFPTTSGGGVYRNALGQVDIDGLTTIIGSTGRNKYGQVVNSIAGDGSDIDSILDGEVYYRSSGDLVLGAKVISDGSATGQDGHGTVVVDGDLIINGDIVYSGDPIDLNNLKELVSVAWIVKGDLIIDSGVSEAIGAFIVMGADGSSCLYGDGTDCDGNREYPQYQRTAYGVAFSADPGAPGDTTNSLTVSGLIFAKAFDFRRTFASPGQGSERIIYDGRLVANPPPGLKGFAEGMPVIRDFLY